MTNKFETINFAVLSDGISLDLVRRKLEKLVSYSNYMEVKENNAIFEK